MFMFTLQLGIDFADVTEGEWGVKEETNDKIRYNAFTVTINNPLAKTAKIDETQVRPIVCRFLVNYGPTNIHS